MLNKSSPLQKVLEWARQHGKGHTAIDPRFNNYVYLIHEDGSSHFYRSAFAVRYRDEAGSWIVVYPEHDDIRVESEDDLLFYGMFKRVKLKEFGLIEGDRR